MKRLININAKTVLAAACLVSLSVVANGQWTGTDNNLSYTDAANWSGGEINDTFTGNNWFSNQQQNTWQIFLNAGSTEVITQPNTYAGNMLVGHSITGDGIPDGTIVTAITSNTTFTISNAATRSQFVNGTYSGTAFTDTIYLVNFNANITSVVAYNNNRAGNAANKLKDGDILNGYVGIPDGTVITNVVDSGDNSTLTLSQPTTANTNMFSPQVNNAWLINITANHTVTGDFTYVSPDIANLNFTPAGGQVWTFTAPNPRITVSMGDGLTNVSRYFNFGADSRAMTVDFSGGNPVFDINPGADGDGVDTFNWAVTTTNAASLTREGSGSLYIRKPVYVDGVVTISGMEYHRYKSTTTLEQTGIINADHVNIVGSRHLLVTQERNVLSGTSLLADDLPVNIYAGGLDIRPQDAITEQTVGPVTVYGRAGIANAIAKVSGTPAVMLPVTLTLASLTRGDFGTVNLSGNNQGGRYLGNYSLIKISGNDQNIRDSLVGGRGADGTTTISIIPWATAQALNGGMGNADSGSWAGSDLVTYTTAGGFRALTASEYVNGAGAGIMGAGDTDNVRVNDGNGATVSADKTINALLVNNGNITIADNVTLTVTSGFLGATTYNGNNSTINTGTNAAIFHGRRSNVVINGDLTNSITDQNQAGLIAANVDGFVNLYGSQKSYTGVTVVQTGLVAHTAYVLPSSTELRIDRDGEARFNASNAVRKLSGVGWLTFTNAAAVLHVTDGGSTILPGAREVRVANGGILAPGDLTGDYRTGTLLLGTRQVNVDVSTLTLGEGSIFEVDISATANDMVESDNYSSTSTLNLEGGTIQLNYLDYTPTAGETDTTFTWALTKGFDNVTGDLDGFTISDLAHPEWVNGEGGYGYNLLLDNTDLVLQLKLEAIPEPSTWALLATGAALLAILRRRRR
ncbi:MAG: PEP-CTERM sorting domain-containing protein [Verrucomicrobiales bacterium]|jgi:hypothetical protein|nr:PEP-CTERM sorting domain-containing protein [Verrucomicrobiales bacterium]